MCISMNSCLRSGLLVPGRHPEECWSNHVIRVLSVSVGKPGVIMERRGEPVLSGIVKRPLEAQTVDVSFTNIAGDGQADLINHGGPDKAVYVYPSEHLPLWRDEIGYDGGVSAFGENLTIEGIDENAACIGDTWHWGAVRLQISQPRWPCFKLAHRTGHPDMVKRFVASGRSGWYMRVLTPGTAAREDPIEVEVKDSARITIREAFDAAISRTSLPNDVRTRIIGHPALSTAWREMLISNE